MMDRLRVVTAQVKGKEKEYLATEEPNIKLVKYPGKSTDIGVIEFSMLADKSKASGSGTTITLAITATPCSRRRTIPIMLISSQLSTPEATCPTDCNIEKTAPGKYEVSYTPVSSGLHQLRVRLGDMDIPGSPWTVRTKTKRTFKFRIPDDFDPELDLWH